jgi:hypothetical protein
MTALTLESVRQYKELEVHGERRHEVACNESARRS